MTTENRNDSANTSQTATTGNVGLEISSAPAPTPTVTVNVGFPGKIQKVLIDANSTVADALRAAEIKADGYDIRMGGAPARLDSRLPEGTANLTILLLKPVKGNC